MFTIWLTSILLYWSKLPYLGLALLLLSVLIQYIRNTKVTHVNIIYAISFVAITYVLWIYKVYDYNQGINNISESINTILHLSILIGCFVLIAPKFQRKTFLNYCFIFSLISVILFFWGQLSIILNKSSIFFFKTATGVYRYEMTFAEPSFLAIYSCILLYFIFNEFKFKGAKVYFISFSLFLNVFMSFSGSGLILLGVIFILLFRFSLRSLTLMVISLCVSIPLLITYTSLPTVVEDRVGRLINNNVDPSTYLRFVAPVLLVLDTFESRPLLGSGLGLSDELILNNYSNYLYLLKKNEKGDSIYNTNIDNAWASLIFNTGIIGFLIVVLLLYTNKKNGFETNTLIFFICTLFFAGAFIHPLFVGMIFYKKQTFNIILPRELNIK